jgi:hypothetical protein
MSVMAQDYVPSLIGGRVPLHSTHEWILFKNLDENGADT